MEKLLVPCTHEKAYYKHSMFSSCIGYLKNACCYQYIPATTATATAGDNNNNQQQPAPPPPVPLSPPVRPPPPM